MTSLPLSQGALALAKCDASAPPSADRSKDKSIHSHQSNMILTAQEQPRARGVYHPDDDLTTVLLNSQIFYFFIH